MAGSDGTLALACPEHGLAFGLAHGFNRAHLRRRVFCLGVFPRCRYYPGAVDRRCADGYHGFFRQRAIENARQFCLAPRGIALAGSDSSSDWRDLGRLLDAATEQGASVELIIYPYHAQLMTMLEQTGLWPLFEQWKLRLLREIARVQQARPQARIRLWDFSGYGVLQCEHIPAPGDRSATTWYWESGHFKAALGDLMLARLFGGAGAVPVPQGFGVRLDAGGWNANRDRIARERSACLAAEPAMFREAAAMVAAFQARRQ